MLKSLIRFLEMDCQFLTMKSSLGLITKLTAIIKADLFILFSFLKPNVNISLLEKNLSYDQVFSPKLFLSACYEFYLSTERASILPKKAVVVDIGANIGQFMFATKLFYPDSKVYCFEPAPKIYEKLEKNAKQYNNVITKNLGIGNRKGKLNFYSHKSYSVFSTLVKPHDLDNYDKIFIDVNTGDKELASLKKIDLLKIDVEGFELETIKGLSKTLRITKFLLIELSIQRSFTSNKSEDVIEIITKNGFKLHSIGRVFDSGPGTPQSAADMLFINTRYK